jgi:hypothetical protein
MEIFAKTLDSWDATLLLDATGKGKFGWKILVEDRRHTPSTTRCITSLVEFWSAPEAILDGHGALEALTPGKVS